MQRNANNGGSLFYEFGGKAVAVSIVNPRFGILIALNVLPEHRSHGLGGAILRFLMPNFARVLENKVPWFEKQGYRSIGKPKLGVSLKTQVMVREALFGLAGKVSKAWTLK